MFKKILLLLCLPVFIVSSCSSELDDISDADTRVICTLKNNLTIMDEPMWFSVGSDSTFFMSDGEKVCRYDYTGEQINLIGHTGKAHFEYSHPMNVKQCDDVVYVWSSATLKFISFTPDGEPLNEYQYNSAIKDFNVMGKYIFIYTAGRSEDHVIDVYDMEKNEVVKSVMESSLEHQAMTHLWSALPLFVYDDKLYFSTKDALKIYSIDGDLSLDTEYEYDGTSHFSVEEISDENSPVLHNRKIRSEYLRENSQTLSIFSQDNHLYLVSLEGKAKLADTEYDTSERLISVYTDEGGKTMAKSFYYNSIDTQINLSGTSDGLYFLGHEIIEDEDVYTLKKILL